MNHTEAESLMERLKQKLPDTLKAKVGDVHLRGLRVHKFSVDVAPPFAEEVSSVLKELLKDDEFRHQGATLYTTAQRRPEVEVRYQGGGKARAFLRANCVQGATAECSWEPNFILTLRQGESEVEVGHVNEIGEVDWHEQNCKAALKMTVPALEMALRGFGRR